MNPFAALPNLVKLSLSVEANRKSQTFHGSSTRMQERVKLNTVLKLRWGTARRYSFGLGENVIFNLFEEEKG
jgi:hypothetical protein